MAVITTRKLGQYWLYYNMHIKRILVSVIFAVVAGLIAAFFLNTGPFSPDGWTIYPPLSALGDPQPDPIALHERNTIITIAVAALAGIVIYAINPGRK